VAAVNRNEIITNESINCKLSTKSNEIGMNKIEEEAARKATKRKANERKKMRTEKMR